MMRIFKENTIAITIDFQERLVPVINDINSIVERAEILIKGLEVLGVPNIVTRQYPKGLGDTIPAIQSVTKNATVYDKVEFSCYDNREIKRAVDDYGCKNIILIGIETHVCVLQTAIDLKTAGYNVVMAVDCIGSRSEKDKEIALDRAKQEEVLVTTSESILFELTRKAVSEEFKQISKLVK